MYDNRWTRSGDQIPVFCPIAFTDAYVIGQLQKLRVIPHNQRIFSAPCCSEPNLSSPSDLGEINCHPRPPANGGVSSITAAALWCQSVPGSLRLEAVWSLAEHSMAPLENLLLILVQIVPLGTRHCGYGDIRPGSELLFVN